MKTKYLNKVNVGGLLFDNVDIDEAVKLIEKRIKNYKNKGTSLLCAANQDIINRIRNSGDFNSQKINSGSFLIIPDGYSIVYASKFIGTPLKSRVAGPDLMEKFIEKASEKGYKNFFLGAKKGVSKKMSDILLKKYPGLKICGIYSPPFGEFTVRENEKIISLVNKSKADVLWVSLGCPKQEKWILENKERLNVPVSAGIGAAFDFLSGNIRRAPKIIQRLRLEWFFRFLQEPSRLWERYFIGGFMFMRTILKQKFF